MNTQYIALKTEKAGQISWLEATDESGLQRFRADHGNMDLLISTWTMAIPDRSAPRSYSLCFRVECTSFEQARDDMLRAVYYLAEACGIPEESIDLFYNGGGLDDAHGMGQQHNGADQDHCDAGGVSNTGSSRPAGPAGPGTGNSAATAGDAADTGVPVADEPVDQPEPTTAAPAEIVILVPPVVFGGRPTPLMLALNYDLARQMVAEGLHVDVDSYAEEQQQFIRLPNSFNSDTGRFVVPIRVEELLHLNAKAIRALSAQPRPDDSYAGHRSVPEASEWFAEALRQAERHAKRQLQLRQQLLQRGWFVPPCIRRLEWVELAREQALEACRLTAALYAFCGASEDEVHEHLRRIDRRNGIGDYPRVRSIVAFGLQNPAFTGCEDPLLHRFCPAGGCFMKELIHEVKNPRLFS
jgi:hypothetical protein